MLGAMGTHLALDHGRHLTSEVVPLTLATIVLIARWPRASVVSLSGSA
jgi:hypothetical protein